MLTLLSVIFPPLYFMRVGQGFVAFLCFLMMLTLVLWPLASVLAVLSMAGRRQVKAVSEVWHEGRPR